MNSVADACVRCVWGVGCVPLCVTLFVSLCVLCVCHCVCVCIQRLGVELVKRQHAAGAYLVRIVRGHVKGSHRLQQPRITAVAVIDCHLDGIDVPIQQRFMHHKFAARYRGRGAARDREGAEVVVTGKRER